MSISPNDAQSSEPRPPSIDPLRSPSSQNGFVDREPRGPLDLPRIESLALRVPDGGATGSAPAAAAELGGGEISGSSLATSGGSKNVSESRRSDGRKGSYGHSNGGYSPRQSTFRGGISSQFGADQLGSINRGPCGNGKFIQSDPLDSGSGGLQVNGPQLALRRNQVVNANHLLNFYYEPISRQPSRAPFPPPRRQRKIKPYNKDLFLQANYKFVVLDTGTYQIESMDPDKMLQWEDIIYMRYSAPYPVQCPICLETPLCPQITSCGHIYCFSCILQYLLMGKEDHKGDCWKKCPLCFMMISSKDLCIIQIENVKQFSVGDRVHFTLLTRPKDSLLPSLKNQGEDFMEYDGAPDSFSKFILTSDVEISVQEAKLNLNNWLIKAESGLVDDLERLPYVCAALEQLEERIKNWMELLAISGSPLRNRVTFSSNSKNTHAHNKRDTNILISTSSRVNSAALGSGGRKFDHDLKHDIYDDSSNIQVSHVPESSGSTEKRTLLNEDKSSQSNCKDASERESYIFYQAVDGQHLILHPLNMKCLLHHYGSYDKLPPRISGEILEMEMLTQSEATRKRYRYLSHLSLTTIIQLCEIDLGEILPLSSLAPFKDEINKREKQRKQLARKEQSAKARAEAALHSMPILYDHNYSLPQKDPSFSLDDFEVLASSAVPATSPPINSTSPPITSERKLFSAVTRLGFAAAHDSPSISAEGLADLSSGNMDKRGNTSNTQGPRPMTTLSFANITAAPKATGTPPAQDTKGLGKKGKKQAKVLLSTAGGRRY